MAVLTKLQLYEKAKILPLLPGVYIIRDSAGQVIYIGKAKRLRTRVSQYFREGVPHDGKVNRMIFAARDFDVIVTTSEYEALVLECSQIKQHQPRYNVLLKDDKGYSYIRVTRESWPRITAVLQKEEDDAEYIGPFLSSFAVRQMVQTVNDCFLLPRCVRRFPEDIGRQRPCLYKHIGLCMGPCSGKISNETYRGAVEDAVHMIRQGKEEIIALLQSRMSQASQAMEYERAALLRDQIRAVEKVNAGQTVVKDGEKEQDVIAFAKMSSAACVAVLRLREGRLVDKREFVFYETESLDSVREEFLPQYYFNEGENVPKVIAVDAPLPGQQLLARMLSEKKGTKVRIYTPERGDSARLIQMAYLNALERLAQNGKHSTKHAKALDELAGLLGLSKPPQIIESYDISNWGEGSSVCGMVVFENGLPKKAGYRRFKINTVQGTDDYASMAEVLSRRAAQYEKGGQGQFGLMPDLILLDGGKGQVHAVEKALQNSAFALVPLFGMVKDAKHRTRGMVKSEGEEIELSMHRGVFTFVTGIQDEVHRFAVDYQRRASRGKTLSLSLYDIPGVGPATAKALLGHFRTLKAVKSATEQELSAVKGVQSKTARAVWEHFHPQESIQNV